MLKFRCVREQKHSNRIIIPFRHNHWSLIVLRFVSDDQWRQQGGGGMGNFSISISNYVCMWLDWLNLSFFVLFQSKTENLLALCVIIFNFTQHNTNQFNRHWWWCYMLYLVYIWQVYNEERVKRHRFCLWRSVVVHAFLNWPKFQHQISDCDNLV